MTSTKRKRKLDVKEKLLRTYTLKNNNIKTKEIISDEQSNTPVENIKTTTQLDDTNDIKTDTSQPLDGSSNLGLPSWLANPTYISPLFVKSNDNDITQNSFMLSKHLITKLQALNYTHWFPIQQSLLSKLFSARFFTRSCQGDLCVSAPTGSGKTLAYAVPIVESLLNRIIPQIRALIILPTRELAFQVKNTFDLLTSSSNLQIGLTVGSGSFTQEQQSLVHELGYSKIDILITTPGRLIDHINSTNGFNLTNVKFLVLDEADRLLNQHYQGWLDTLYKAMTPTHQINKTNSMLPVGLQTELQLVTHKTQKLLFSATLTRNPEKIASLKLEHPTYITVSSNLIPDQVNQIEMESYARYTIPSTLLELRMVVSSIEDKPLVLLNLLLSKQLKGVLVFVKSVQSSYRLSLLINHCFKLIMGDKQYQSLGYQCKSQSLTSDLSTSQRKKVLNDFKNNELQVLVCSDMMARGMDIGK
ncbi:ATP-dependent RNA helicase ddx51 [Globomyces sp. JEL0801]|nr:ATP-dependent RNA helicase ddx51 [Globomyces sp. JEL0801]